MSQPIRLVGPETAIVVVDLQMGVVRRRTVPWDSAAVLRNTARLLEAGRRHGATVILVYVDGAGDGKDRLQPEADVVPKRELPADYSVLAPELRQQPSDILVVKRNWGAFYGTDLDLQLRRRKLNTIVIGGIATEFGVESTARDAFERGYRQVFASDATGSFSQESYDNCMQRVFTRMGYVRTTDEVIAAFREPAGSAV